jgi:MFS family permease
MLGFLLDAMDVLLYVFAIQALRAEFSLSNAQAGLVSTSSSILSALGGIAAGALSDRLGRRRLLMYTVLLYSFASAGTALSGGLVGLLFWRSLVGLGLGGEWTAGATLVAEHWPAEQRGRAISFLQSGWALGYMLAAVLAGLILPRFGWRALFLVGVLPALLTIFIRRKVVEPEIWLHRTGSARWGDVLRPPLLRSTVVATALAAVTMFAYWGTFTWLPGFLSATRASGGAGFDVIKTSTWVFVMQGGAYAGYLSFGVLADRFGRRITFAGYVLMAAIVTPIYGFLPGWGSERLLLVLGPVVGFVGTGFFSLFGSMLAELYPTAVRGMGQGLTYNLGRGLGSLAPFVVGAAADRRGFGLALALCSGFYLLAAVLVFALPETKGRDLGTGTDSSVEKSTETKGAE